MHQKVDTDEQVPYTLNSLATQYISYKSNRALEADNTQLLKLTMKKLTESNSKLTFFSQYFVFK